MSDAKKLQKELVERVRADLRERFRRITALEGAVIDAIAPLAVSVYTAAHTSVRGGDETKFIHARHQIELGLKALGRRARGCIAERIATEARTIEPSMMHVIEPAGEA